MFFSDIGVSREVIFGYFVGLDDGDFLIGCVVVIEISVGVGDDMFVS